jgi:AcrR family transcriptional regulator
MLSMLSPVKSPRRTKAKDRILAGAEELFYRDGFNVTGVDAVSAGSRVSKTSLYRLFGSKDELITAVILEQDKRFWKWWENVVERHPNGPHTLLIALLTGIGDQIEQPEFRGCAFLNLANEITDSAHPARVFAKANKERMLGEIGLLLTKLGATTPERTAAQILLLINGAYASSLVGGIPNVRSHLVDAAMKLIAA